MTSHTNPDDRIDAVLFDLDDTLVEYEQDADDVLAAAFERAGVEPFCTADELEAAAEDGPDRDHRTVWVEAFRRAAERAGADPTAAPDLYEAYGAELDRTQVTWRPGARRVLRTARERFPVGIVTNGERAIQERKLARLGLTDAFETVVCADDVPEPKPATDPFDAPLDALGVPADRALYVGDSYRYDVVGAHRAGLQAAWWPADDAARAGSRSGPHHVVETAADLVALLSPGGPETGVSG